MMIEIKDNPLFLWIQTPDGSVNINELFRVSIIPKGTDIQSSQDPKELVKTQQEQIALFFKMGQVLLYAEENALYADLKDQLIRSAFLRVQKPPVHLIKPGPN